MEIKKCEDSWPENTDALAKHSSRVMGSVRAEGRLGFWWLYSYIPDLSPPISEDRSSEAK